MDSHQVRYTLIGALSLLFWGTVLPFARRVTEDLGPFSAASSAMIISGVVGLIVFRLAGRITTLAFIGTRAYAIRCGLFFTYVALVYLALSLVDREQVPTVTFLNYIWPTATILFSILLFPRPIRRTIFICGSGLVFTGMAIELLGENVMDAVRSAGESRFLVAYIAAAVAGLSWGLWSALARRWGDAAGGTIGVPFVFLTVGLLVAPLAWVMNEQPKFSLEVLPALLFLASSPMLGHLCWDIGMRRGNVVVLSLLADTLPWISLTFAKLYLGVTITAGTWWAAAFIVAGAVVSRISMK